MFANNGLPDEGRTTRACISPAISTSSAPAWRRIFDDPGLRFVFSTRSSVPDILKEDGSPFYGEGWQVRAGQGRHHSQARPAEGTSSPSATCSIARVDAVTRLQESGVKVGLINKPTLNVNDPATMKMLKDVPFVLVAECFNVRTGVGSRFGTDLLMAALKAATTTSAPTRKARAEPGSKSATRVWSRTGS